MKTLRTRQERLHDLLMAKYQTHKQRLQGLLKRRVFQFPLERLHEQERRVDDWDDRVQRAMRVRVQRAKQKIEATAAQLESLSPLNVLARGYSLTRTVPAQAVVRSVTQVAVGDAVEIMLADGSVRAKVQDV